jgi:hypothetical protein
VGKDLLWVKVNALDFGLEMLFFFGCALDCAGGLCVRLHMCGAYVTGSISDVRWVSFGWAEERRKESSRR